VCPLAHARVQTVYVLVYLCLYLNVLTAMRYASYIYLGPAFGLRGRSLYSGRHAASPRHFHVRGCAC